MAKLDPIKRLNEFYRQQISTWERSYKKQVRTKDEIYRQQKRKREERYNKRLQRYGEIYKLWVSGMPLKELQERFGISRQRIFQILKIIGITQKDKTMRTVNTLSR